MRAFLKTLFIASILVILLAGYQKRHLLTFLYSGQKSSTLSQSISSFYKVKDWLEGIRLLHYDQKQKRYVLNYPSKNFYFPFFFNNTDRARFLWYKGMFQQAIDLLTKDIADYGETEEKLYWLAFSYARLGEEKNCLQHLRKDGIFVQDALCLEEPGEKDMGRMCSLPLQLTHKDPYYSKRAIVLFEKLLDEYDPQNKSYRWLLNFYYMTINGHPKDVPSKYLIKSDFTKKFSANTKEEVARQFSHLKFRNVAKEYGVDSYNAGRGIAVEDFNGDGLLDIIDSGSYEGLIYYQNDKGKGFLNKSQESGLKTVANPFILSAADYDNDGDMDLLVIRWLLANSLLQNDGQGHFTDVTVQSGLPQSDDTLFNWIPAWADVDNDGDLDLFLSSWGEVLPMIKVNTSKLLENRGGKFVDVTEKFGLSSILDGQAIQSASFGDYDNDGDLDLFISHYVEGQSLLLDNQAGKKFKINHKFKGEAGFASSFLDINHDGQLDIFQAGVNIDTDKVIEGNVFAISNDSQAGRSKIYFQKDKDFSSANSDVFPDHGWQNVMGVNYGDLNNDGCFDFYMGTGNQFESYILPNLMYVGEKIGGECTGNHANISSLFGFGTIQKGHGIVFFDFDNDGDQDIYSSLGGMWPADKWPNQLFLNESKIKNDWIKVRLVGEKSNRFGLNARVRVTFLDNQGLSRKRYFHLTNQTGFGSAPLLAHIGLGKVKELLKLEVLWPGESRWSTHQGKLNHLNVLYEKNSQY